MSVTTRYKFGGYILRERKGRYYVYKLEGANGDVRETYVGPLIDVVETYLKLKLEAGVLGGCPPNGPGGIRTPDHRLRRRKRGNRPT